MSNNADRPTPDGASCPAEFVEAMGRLKEWTGLTVRELEKRADQAGERLPRSTLTAALARDSLPRQALVEAFVRACGGDDEEIDHWVTVRRRLAAGGVAEVVPPPRPRPGRQLMLIGAVLVLLMGGTGLAILKDQQPHGIPPQGALIMAKPAEGVAVGALRTMHDYDVICTSKGWSLVFVRTTQVVGFVRAENLPEMTRPDCADTGEEAALRTNYHRLHSRPDEDSEHVGDLKLGVGTTERVRWYVYTRGASYQGQRGWYALLDPSALDPVVGFVSCTDTVLECDR